MNKTISFVSLFLSAYLAVSPAFAARQFSNLAFLDSRFAAKAVKPQEMPQGIPGKNGLITTVETKDLGEKYIPGYRAIYEGDPDHITVWETEDRRYINLGGITYIEYFPKTVRVTWVQKTHQMADRNAYIRSQKNGWGWGAGLTTGIVLGATAGILLGSMKKNPLLGVGVGLATALGLGSATGLFASNMAGKNAEAAPEVWKDNPYTDERVVRYYR